eukprot:9480943-Pyramimonas_sp.AAC.1
MPLHLCHETIGCWSRGAAKASAARHCLKCLDYLANASGTMINGALTILLNIGSNINIIGLKTAQTFEPVSRPHGRAIKRLNLTKRLYVSEVGHGAAILEKALHCKIARKERIDPAGAPAVPRLDTYSANVAEGYAENLPALLGLRSMSNMGAILILEQGHEKMIIPGAEMYNILLGRGAGVFDLMKTPSGHLALKADENGAATEDQGSMSFIIAANPQREVFKETSDPEPIARTPAVNDAHACMMSQDSKGISSSINEETLTFTIQSL